MNDGQQGCCIHSMKGHTGHSSLLKLSGGETDIQIVESDRFNSLLIKMLQFFILMLIMFDLNPVVKIYFMKFFHNNQYEIHKNRTLGKKSERNPD